MDDNETRLPVWAGGGLKEVRAFVKRHMNGPPRPTDELIDATNLSVRIKNACRLCDIRTVAQLQDLPESKLLRMPGIGALSRAELIACGIREPPPPPPPQEGLPRLDILRAIWRKASPAERTAFRAEIEEDQP